MPSFKKLPEDVTLLRLGSRWADTIWMPLLLCSIPVVLLYWRVLGSPFVQDDWFALDVFNRASVSSVIRDLFSPAGKILYRPLGTLYLLGMYLAAGLAVIPFHIVALLIHLGNAFLVVLVVRQVTNKDMLSLACGVLYAVAATVHIEPLLWFVGFYDLGGILFSLVAIYLFMRGRWALSAAAFFAAILIKESTVGTFGVLFFYCVLLERNTLKRLIPHLTITVLYILVKAWGISPFSLPADDPYKAQLFGTHLQSNLTFFGRWALEAIFPFDAWLPRFAGGLLVIAFALLIIWQFWRIRSKSWEVPNEIWFLTAWMLLGLSPVVFLTNHCSKYYIATSLIPFLALLLLLFDFAIPHSFRRLRQVLLIFFVGVVVISHWLNLERQFANPGDKVRVGNGTNNLIQKAGVVRSLHTELVRQFPRLPDSSTVIIDEADIGPMGGAIAARLWYQNSTIDVVNRQTYDSLAYADRQYLARPVFVLKLPSRFGPVQGETEPGAAN